MAISIICTGYANWACAEQVGTKIDGDMHAYDVAPDVITVTLDNFGIEMTDEIDGVGSAQTFRYQEIKVGGVLKTEEFTSTALSILFKVNINKMTNWNVEDFTNDYREASLLVTCAVGQTLNNKDFSSDNFGVGTWLTPESATLYVLGYPNVSRAVTMEMIDGKLEMVIPMVELYNLLSPCWNGATTEGEAKYLPVELVIDFKPTGTNAVTEKDSSYSLNSPCNGWGYVFSAQLAPKT